MYYDYFGLTEAPFSIAPNPEYLYMSARHREALAHLLYGIRGDGGFVLLTGEVGTGKTTVSRCLLEQIPEDTDVAFVLNPKLTAVELLATVCDDLGIEYPEHHSIKTLTDRLNEHLLQALQNDRRTVLIIDEAQNLSIDVLEQLRLLTNLETNQRKLLQIILLGQPELLALLAKSELRQLSQRVTARFHLDALDQSEVADYIRHRLSVAGGRGNCFTARAIKRVYAISRGIPRVINLVCDRAMLGAYAGDKNEVTHQMVNQAALEVFGAEQKQTRHWPSLAAAAVLVLSVLGVVMVATRDAPTPTPTTQQTVQAKVETIPEAKPVPEPEPEAAQPERVIAEPFITTTITPEEPSVTYSPLAQALGHGNRTAAQTDLFTQWGIYVPAAEGDLCEETETLGLACFTNLASLDEIENLNRPVILRLGNSWFTMVALDSEGATLIAGDRQYQVTRQDIIDAWGGWYTLLWRPPAGYEGPLAIGNRGPAVAELRAAMDTEGEPVFDQDFKQTITRFQLSSGLIPDGVVGAKTWIHINSGSDSDVPRLSAVQGGER